MNQEVKKKFFFTNDSKVSLFWNMIILISFVISKYFYKFMKENDN